MNTLAENPALSYTKIYAHDGNTGTLEKISALVPLIIYTYDAATKKLHYLNNKITEILGFDVEEVDTWDNYIKHLVYKDDAALAYRGVEEQPLLEDAETLAYQCRLNHKLGYCKYFNISVGILNYAENNEGGVYLFTAEDIDQTVSAGEEITAKNNLISETEEILQFGTWSWDATTGNITLSDGLFALLGCTREDTKTISSNPLKFISQEDIDILSAKATKSAVDKQAFEHTYNLTTLGGQQKIVRTNGKVLLSQGGELAKIIGTTRDVTEQINAYRELYYYKQMMLEKEQFLESGSWEVDLTTDKIDWSDGMYRLFEYNRATDGPLPELTAEFYFSHFSDEEAKQRKSEWDTFLKNKDNFVREETITAKNGSRKRLETFGKVIRQHDGKPVKVMGATKDISRLKEYERQLEKKLIELERSNKDLEEFAYVASHDLQEPLRKISTFSERLKVKFENELGEDGKAYITRMLAATANMRMLIENLLNFSRLTSKAIEYVKTDLNVLMDEVLTEIELQIDESSATVNKQTLPVLQVIPSQIKQLLSNIILNAIKFRRPGVAPVIEITCAKLTDVEKDNNNLQKFITYFSISIQDNGIGFEQEYAEKIFQIFQRLHGKSEYPGAGIGLAICKKIAENHHGKLFAVGQNGNGAVFTVILPEANG